MKSLVLTAVLASSSALALAADNASISGKWTLHSNIAGNESNMVCTFTQQEADLIGTCKSDTGGNKVTGKVAGMHVSFSYTSEYGGSPFTAKYTGILDPVTNKISGTVNVAEFSVDGDFTATSASPGTAIVSTAAVPLATAAQLPTAAPSTATAASNVAAQDAKEFLGRWDLVATPATGKILSALDRA